jgi:hypothetical protein
MMIHLGWEDHKKRMVAGALVVDMALAAALGAIASRGERMEMLWVARKIKLVKTGKSLAH